MRVCILEKARCSCVVIASVVWLSVGAAEASISDARPWLIVAAISSKNRKFPQLLATPQQQNDATYPCLREPDFDRRGRWRGFCTRDGGWVVLIVEFTRALPIYWGGRSIRWDRRCAQKGEVVLAPFFINRPWPLFTPPKPGGMRGRRSNVAP